MRYLAMHDPLTDLFNRHGFVASAEQRLVEGQVGATLIHFNLDRFNAINDTLGHQVGDKLLVAVAERLRTLVDPGALIGRIGGDEFAVLQSGTLVAATGTARMLAEELARPFMVSGHRVMIETSVGVAATPQGSPDLTQLIRHAGLALQESKRQGRGRATVFQETMEKAELDRLTLERDLAGAVVRGELKVVYQPQVDLATGDLVGVEALVRWQHPRRGMVPPNLFIPIAEESGIIHQITEWVLLTACTDAAGWARPIKLAVNISPVDLHAGEVPAMVMDALKRSGLGRERLELEITETAFVQGGEAVEESFHRIKALGIGFLQRFSFGKLKIDKSFVDGIPHDPEAMAIMRAIIMLAQGLGLRTIAEGIETEKQRQALGQLGCQLGQGYLFSKPVDGAAIAAMLAPARELKAAAS
jgi:diguanylate cyclase (GGDEF)-like protein